MRAWRIGLIGCGAVFVAWGVLGLFAEQSPAKLAGLALWLGATVFVHDGLLVPLTLLVGLVGHRLLRRAPHRVRQVIAAGAVVAGVLTLLAVPSIIRHPVVSNPTALPQSYGRNLIWLWLVVVAVTGAAALWAWSRSRRGRGRRR